MGTAVSKHGRELRAKIHVLEDEIRELKRERDNEARAYEESVVVLACKEEEWKQERKKHRDEMARVQMRLKEEEEKARTLEDLVAANEGEKGRHRFSEGRILEKMKEEQARREEAVEKWKQLYHAIKSELDDLIHSTRQGERFYCCFEEGLMEALQSELKAKEEMLEVLRSRLVAAQLESIKKERELDILRQSLRILSNAKRNNAIRNNTGKYFRSRKIA